MPDPVIHDLRKVDDEALFERLHVLKQRMPQDTKAADYLYQYETWTMAHQAVYAEIRRRKAVPPTWWRVVAQREEIQRRRMGLVLGYFATAAAAVLLFGTPVLAFTVMLTVLLFGMIWLISVIRENQYRR